MNQKILAIFRLVIILILKNLVIWQKNLFETKDKKKNNDFVEEIKNRWSKLKDEMEKLSDDDEKKNRGLRILEILKKVLKFNEQKKQ